MGDADSGGEGVLSLKWLLSLKWRAVIEMAALHASRVEKVPESGPGRWANGHFAQSQMRRPLRAQRAEAVAMESRHSLQIKLQTSKFKTPPSRPHPPPSVPRQPL